MMRSKFGKPTRFAAVAVAALMGIGVGVVLGQNSFTDIQVEDPRRADINYANQQGWFRGYPDGSFRPDRRISEEQLARVIRRAHPGLTRGDAAVFLRGGMDRLRAAGITTTTTTTTTVATTAAAPTGGPGGPGGPGGEGPVDPNPPVVNDPTAPATEATTTTVADAPATGATTTTVADAPATGATTTTAADAATTTTAPPADARYLVRYGFETGWFDSEGRSGSLVWSELAIRDYNPEQDVALSNWWSNNGYARLKFTGTDHKGVARQETVKMKSSSTFVRLTITDVEVVQVNCGDREGCTSEGDMPMPQATRDWANDFGYFKVVPTTTTTTAATTTTTQPTGRIVAYGKEGGWIHPTSGITRNVVWWERRNWGGATPEVTLVMSYSGSIISEDPTEEYWFAETQVRPFTVRDVSCFAECTTILETSMPASIRSQLLAAGYTKSGS